MFAHISSMLFILYRYFYFPKDCKNPEQPANGVVNYTQGLKKRTILYSLSLPHD